MDEGTGPFHGRSDLGVDPTPRLTILKVVEPAKRQAGVKVKSVAELVAVLGSKSVGVSAYLALAFPARSRQMGTISSTC